MLLQRPEELVIDVTGPASADDVTADDVTALTDDVTLVHVSDVRSLLTNVYHDESDELSSTLPLVVYVLANETAPGKVCIRSCHISSLSKCSCDIFRPSQITNFVQAFVRNSSFYFVQI